MLNGIGSFVLSLIAIKSFDEAVDARADREVRDIVDVAQNEAKWQGYKDGFRDGVKDALLGKANKFQNKGI